MACLAHVIRKIVDVLVPHWDDITMCVKAQVGIFVFGKTEVDLGVGEIVGVDTVVVEVLADDIDDVEIVTALDTHGFCPFMLSCRAEQIPILLMRKIDRDA